MIRKFFEWAFSPMGRIAVLIAFLSLFSLGAYGLYQTQQPPEQPIQFTQVACGVGDSMPLLPPRRIARISSPVCRRSANAGDVISKLQNTNQSALETHADAMAKGEGFGPQWRKVPDFVHFNNRPHIAAGLKLKPVAAI
ncbi:MAG: hypothetical protein U0X93_11740 [Anaerolineales bacterium]